MLRDILLDWILFTFWETLIIVLFINHDKLKTSFRLAICLSVLLSCLYTLCKFVTVPLSAQFVNIVLTLILSKYYYKMNWRIVIIKLLCIFGIMFICDSASVFIVEEIFKINVLDNIIYLSISLIPSKLFQFITILNKRSDEIMKWTWGSIERR